MPLADRVRPKTLDDVAGQAHLLSKNAPFRRIIEAGELPSLVFYGPPGVGKTTVAEIIARLSDKQLYKINATSASLSDVRGILSQTNSLSGISGIVLYIDEIQYFNKKQQQSLLEYVEDGRVTLVCSTTENPYFTIYGALLSRSSVFEFKGVDGSDITPVLARAKKVLDEENGVIKECGDEVLSIIAGGCGGDIRKALTALENVYRASDNELLPELARQLTQRSGMRFDRDGNEHYDLLSAFQKSIRGSDENAAVFYLARLLDGGDLLSPCRRLLVIASEDIGLAYPTAVSVVKACVDSALQIGLPEAGIPLAQAVIYLSTLPKSNSAIGAYHAALGDISKGKGTNIPEHLRDKHRPDGDNAPKYRYPHDYPYAYVKQQYLPSDLKNRVYYTPGENKTERAAADYWRAVKEPEDKKQK